MTDSPSGKPGLDLFDRRERIISVGQDIESLANRFFGESEPLRSALNDVLRVRKESEAWPNKLLVAAANFPPKQAESAFLPWLEPPPRTSPPTPNQFASLAMWNIIEAAATDDRPRFTEWLAKGRSDERVAENMPGLLTYFAAEILKIGREDGRKRFAQEAKTLLADVGVEPSGPTAGELVSWGVTLSPLAEDALGCCDDPSNSCVNIGSDGLLLRPGRLMYPLVAESV